MPFFSKTRPNPDPNPGIGGYDYPRGPYGATGYRGSTSDVRNNPSAAESLLHDDYVPRRSRQRWHTFAEQQARFNQDNWNEPFNPDRVRDTEKRNHGVISTGIPGGQNVRNSRYRGGPQAQPGQAQRYRSAPNPGMGAPQNVTQDSRYVFGGVNGGTDLYQDTLDNRRMPYTGQDGYRGNLRHARGGIRGAVNDGTRFFQGPPILVNQGGVYGESVRGKDRHRPTLFREPAPWTGKYYDTTHGTGTLSTAGAQTQVQPMVHVSPQAGARRNRGF